MLKKYNYLLEDLRVLQEDTLNITNKFYPVAEESILEAEKSLGLVFPPELKEFYKEIGYGFLRVPKNATKEYRFYGTNRINPPSTIQDIMLQGQSSGLISEEAYELLKPGDLPFFEIHDSSNFLIMKPNSENPNAIWAFDNIKIEDSFERFIWRLYYENPIYYGDIIEVAYK